VLAGELQHVAARFGVSEPQVLRDHLISHLLAALSIEAPDSVIFFGGTALARSIVPDGSSPRTSTSLPSAHEERSLSN
jgi:predicted nucleotidyltransferase component of viral defense system